MEQLIDIENASRVLKIEVATVYRWVHRRKIPFVKIGSALRFRPSALEEWVKEREHHP